jgi:phenylacetyl-CoA:acceptor oxidoreductase subunit 2
MGGGAGTGLLITSALFATSDDARTGALSWLVFAGLVLVGLGLMCVWLEIGRPLRALHVFFNPRTSWMSREGFVGLLLFPAGLLAMLGAGGWIWVTAGLALAFLYCQSRMLPAARGIPAWRAKLVTPVVFVTGLTEGCGLYLLLGLLHEQVSGAVMMLAAVLVLVRLGVWMLYRRGVDASLVPRARAALDIAGRRLLIVGSILPVLLLGLGAGFTSGGTTQLTLAAIGGVCAAFAGAAMKYTLVTRASFNQGFALAKIPVRGVRSPPQF